MKNVIVLISRCIIISIPLWIFCLYANYAKLAYFSPDSVGGLWNKEFADTTQETYYDVVILGDSTSATSMLPELLSDTTINLAVIGTGVIDNYYTLENYLEHNKAPKDIFISFMDYHIDTPSFTWTVSGQTNKLSWEQYYEIYKAEKMLDIAETEDFSLDSYWRDVLTYKIGFPNKYVSSVMASIGTNRYKANKESYDNITRHLGRYCIMTNDEYISEGGLGYKSYHVDDVQDYYYKKLLQVCDDNNIRLHILKLPLTNDMYYSDEYISQVNSYYDSLIAGYNNVEFVWYPADYDFSMYRDIYHMNQHGSFKFSNELKKKYPEVFSYDKYSPQRVLALNEDIKLESNSEYLFRWTKGKKYCVLICDGVGLINMLDTNGQVALATDVPGIYYVNCDGATDNSFSVNAKDGLVNISISGDEDNVLKMQLDNSIKFIVYDKYNNQVVRSCSAKYDEATGRLGKLK